MPGPSQVLGHQWKVKGPRGSDFASALKTAQQVLATQGLGGALVGGLAVATLTGVPRLIGDVDLAVPLLGGDAAVPALIAHLQRRCRCRVGYLVRQRGLERGRYAALRLHLPSAIVDLSLAMIGIEAEHVADARLRWVHGVQVPVAPIGHLLAGKILSQDAHRPQDAIDLLALLKAADVQEIHRARQLLQLITARGYHRGKDLQGALDALLASPGRAR